MLVYLIIALSFAISSTWFIHKRGLAIYNVIKYDIKYDIIYIITVTILFPLVLIFWLINSEQYIKDYGKYLSKIIKEIGN